MASGVHGKMDLTVPSGGMSSPAAEPAPLSGVGRCDAGGGRSVIGEMNRMLRHQPDILTKPKAHIEGTDLWYRLNRNWWFKPSTSFCADTTDWRYWS